MKQVIKYIVIVLCVIFIVLLAAPFLFKKQILRQVKKAANRQLNATLTFDNDISLSFIRNFPNASLGITQLTITGKGEYQGDTLASIGDTHVVIDLFSLFGGGTYRIRNVELEHPYVQMLVDSAGRANWDITTADTGHSSQSPSTFKASLQKYSIHGGHLVFSDSANGFYLEARDLDHEGKGDFTSTVFDLSTSSHAKGLTVAYRGIPYLDDIETDIDAVLHIDLAHSTYTLKHNSITLNGLTLDVDGSVSLPDSNNINMDLSFKTSDGRFWNFLSLIPAVYKKDFNKLKASGTMALSGHVKGVYNDNSIPAFTVELKVADGMFKYPSVPEPLSDVNLDLIAKNDDGNPDHTLIDIRQLHFRMGSSPFDAHLTLKNFKTDPLIDGAVKGTLNLTEVSKIYPLEKGTKLGGILHLDMQAKGALGSLENKNAGQFSASGEVVAQDLAYRSASFQQGIEIPQGTISFSPQAAKIDELKARIGRSDLEANGSLDNLFGYLFSSHPLKGSLVLRSHLLDLNSIMGTKAAVHDTSSTVKAVKIPKNLDLAVQAAIDSFVYSTYVLTSVRGKAVVSGGALQLEDVRAGMLGGQVRLSGIYDTRHPAAIKTDLSLSVDSIDIAKAFRTFATIRAFAPAAAFARGNLSGDLSLSALLNDKLNPRWQTVNSHGKLRIPDLAVAGFAPLKKMASALGLAELENMNIPKVNFSYTIDSGFFRVKPFDFTVDGIRMNVSGKNSLDKKIDYHIGMNIPRSRLGTAGNALNNLLGQAAGLAGVSAKASDQVDVGVLLTGTVTDPTVSLDLSKEKQKLEGALKSGAEQKISQEKTKLLDQLFKKDSGQKKIAPAKTVEQALKKGLQGLLNPKKDSGR